MALITFLSYVVDKKDEVKEIKSEKKKKSDSGTDEPPPKKSKINDEGKITSFQLSKENLMNRISIYSH